MTDASSPASAGGFDPASLKFDDRGLIPAIAQADGTGEVLMMAWMNAEAVAETLASGHVTYWSRSRARFWKKGETSGHVQRLIEMRIDCDRDCLLLIVEQTGPACHTNRRSCFYTAIREGAESEILSPDPSGVSADSWSSRLSPANLKKLALGLLLGAIGGAVADYFDVPLAWMLGALFVTMFARVAGAPIDVPIWVRANFLILIGLFLGESFEGVQIAELLQWPISIAGAMLYVPVATACAFLFYRYLAGEQKMTAICSSIPGGLIAVVVVSGSLGADERQVALAQSLRIAIVVCMAPLVAFGLLGYAPPSDATFEKHALIALDDLAILIVGAFAVMWVMQRCRVPIPYMVGPLLASAVLRLMGVVEGVLPHQLVEVALVVTGSSIGTRFHGVSPARLFSFGLLTLGGTSILMLVSAVFALAVSTLTGQDFLVALLAYAPGGVAEMSLIALAIDANPGFVAIHHVARIIFVLLSVPLLTAWVGRARGAGE